MLDHRPKIIFYVQYLLGIGHIRRSALIIQSLNKLDVDVHVIFGGYEVPNVDFGSATIHQLPPVHSSDNNFSDLINEHGEILSEQEKHNRARLLIGICESVKPNLIVTETYPFGRRQMRFELIPLLEWSQICDHRPVMVSSIRDILQTKKAKREQESVDYVSRFYDHILVHGDAGFTPLSATFSLAGQLENKITYTGYVCPQPPVSRDREKLLVFSSGSGPLGIPILETALELHATGFASDYHWLLITGPNMDTKNKTRFLNQQSNNLKVVELADDFLDSLSRASLSISRGGYNTTMDLLQTHTPALIIPFEGEKETEQLTRSQLLQDKGILNVLREDKLSVNTLQKAIESSLLRTRTSLDIAINGADIAARNLHQWATQHHQDTEIA